MEFPIQRVTYFFFFLVVVVLPCVLFDYIHILSRVRVFAPAETPVFFFVSVGVCLRQRVCVRPEVAVNVQHRIITVAILAQGTNRGDALCAALLINRITSIPAFVAFW